LLNKRHHLDANLTEKVGYASRYIMKSKDIRDVIRIAKLTKSSNDVEWLVNVQMRSGKNRDSGSISHK